MKHFIFGYGSLICPQSRAVTAPSLKDAVAEPVVISHIERTWSARVSKCQLDDDYDDVDCPGDNGVIIRGWTPMGVRFRRGAECNGVLISVDEEELFQFDVREVGYVRRRIDLADVHPHASCHPTAETDADRQLALDDVRCAECRRVFEMARAKRRGMSNDATGDRRTDATSPREWNDVSLWVYVQRESLPAERSFPITQSYVDIIMRGCLSISHDFARVFLRTTHGWWNDDHHGPLTRSDVATTTAVGGGSEIGEEEEDGRHNHHTWVNDRHAPMYVRADSEYSIEHGSVIDDLIGEHHPHALLRRVDLRSK